LIIYLVKEFQLRKLSKIYIANVCEDKKDKNTYMNTYILSKINCIRE